MTTDHDELLDAWETWDDQCLRRPIPQPDGTYRTRNHLPTDRATRRMEAACESVAHTLNVTPSELRIVLTALRRIGHSRPDALARTVNLFTVDAA